ncbi:ABC transporter permease [Lachnospiraceae bacterium Marseille-Q4251]|nr:ABC transporter permease [Lachnospiraceae bacterium Marseille-Q4251]
MNKGFYLKMAWGNIRKNRNIYLPYLLAASVMTALFYIQGSLCDMVDISGMKGKRMMSSLLGISTPITGIFSLVILFYVNSFVMKQRKKEFGLYNVLGMEKRHLVRLMSVEILLVAVFSLVFGISGGALFSQLFFLIFYKMIRMEADLTMVIPRGAVIETLTLFGILFCLVLLYDIVAVIRTRPVELLKSESQGEREPKVHGLAALIGVAALTGGYVIAQKVESPMEAMLWFFAAALLVIIGTYGLFMAGSIALLKWMKKRECFYYRPSSFISVSGMLYRMKQNAAGLAGICILSTMVMVTIGASLCIFSGVGEGVREEYPREYFLQMHYSEDLKPETYQDTTSDVKKLVEAQMEENGSRVENMLSYTRCNMVYRKGKDGYEAEMGDLADTNDYENLVYVQYLLREDYEANTGKKTELPDDVAAFYESEEGLIPGETLLFGDYSIKGKRLEEPVETAVASRYSGIKKRVQVLLPGIEEMEKLTESLGKNFETYYGLEEGEGPGAMYFLGWNWYFDISGKQEPAEEFLEKFRSSWETEKASEWAYISTFQNRTEEEEYLFQEYGTILFIGFFLGMIFLLATVLIIYYKQVTEGYDDRKRFVIMQDIGLSQAEVKKTIRTQVLLVFFLPLGAAGLHMAMAFKVLVKMMALFSAYNIKLFSLCIGLTVAVFALVYFLVYTVTARIYYKIVSNAR